MLVHPSDRLLHRASGVEAAGPPVGMRERIGLRGQLKEVGSPGFEDGDVAHARLKFSSLNTSALFHTMKAMALNKMKLTTSQV